MCFRWTDSRKRLKEREEVANKSLVNSYDHGKSRQLPKQYEEQEEKDAYRIEKECHKASLPCAVGDDRACKRVGNKTEKDK